MSCSDIEKCLEYRFSDISLLEDAISYHRSFKGLSARHMKFEKLEFLGDRVLGLCVASILYEDFTKENEANFATRLANVASTKSLINVAKKHDLLKYFALRKQEKIHKSSSIADMMEAMLAAVFLDGGFENAKKVVAKLFGDEIHAASNIVKDNKTKLQEYSQRHKYGLPVYEVISEVGPQHNLSFSIRVSVNGMEALGKGHSKRAAEQDAARKLLLEIENEQKV